MPGVMPAFEVIVAAAVYRYQKQDRIVSYSSTIPLNKYKPIIFRQPVQEHPLSRLPWMQLKEAPYKISGRNLREAIRVSRR